jgi:hypothetical protein
MDNRAVVSGAIVWFLGILVPVLHHSLLMIAAVQEDNWSYSFSSMVGLFKSLPLLVWIYVLGMFLVGLLLIIRGLRRAKPVS